MLKMSFYCDVKLEHVNLVIYKTTSSRCYFTRREISSSTSFYYRYKV